VAASAQLDGRIQYFVTTPLVTTPLATTPLATTPLATTSLAATPLVITPYNSWLWLRRLCTKGTAVEQRVGFVLTKLQLQRGVVTREAEHYWFNSWPDHGVPTHDGVTRCDDVLNMLMEVNTAMATRACNPDAPILVHCSSSLFFFVCVCSFRLFWGSSSCLFFLFVLLVCSSCLFFLFVLLVCSSCLAKIVGGWSGR
jgi:hypothetical protein